MLDETKLFDFVKIMFTKRGVFNKIKNYNCINSSMQDTEDYNRYYDLIKKVNELKNDFYLKSKF